MKSEFLTKLLQLYISVHGDVDFRDPYTKWKFSFNSTAEVHDLQKARFYQDGWDARITNKDSTYNPVILYFTPIDDGMMFKIYNTKMTELVLEFPCIGDCYQDFLQMKLELL